MFYERFELKLEDYLIGAHLITYTLKPRELSPGPFTRSFGEEEGRRGVQRDLNYQQDSTCYCLVEDGEAT